MSVDPPYPFYTHNARVSLASSGRFTRIGTVSGKVADDDDWEGSVWSVCHGLMGGSEWSALEELFLAAVSPCSLRVSLVHSTMFISYSAC